MLRFLVFWISQLRGSRSSGGITALEEKKKREREKKHISDRHKFLLQLRSESSSPVDREFVSSHSIGFV